MTTGIEDMSDTAETFGAKRVDRSGGALHQKYCEAKVAGTDLAHQVKNRMDDLIEERPYTMLAGAFVVGFLYALARR
jgi:hypothetical protein